MPSPNSPAPFSPAADAPSLGVHTPPARTEGGFGIYVHWPFCLSKCPYCDFNSHVVARVDEARFANALVRELTFFRERTGARRLDSVFFGGGTPSLMAPETVEAVLTAIDRAWGLPPDAEVSLEANPTSVEADRFRGYRAAGVNRVSLGVQALDDAALKKLGRLHTAHEALAAVRLARATFPRLSFDLIYARPGQTMAAWRQELAAALDEAADHLSAYQLTIEPGTAYARLYEAGALELPPEELAHDLYEATEEIAAARGLHAYEVSNYAAPRAECRHNLVYWRYGDYVGVGPGAHGRITMPQGRFATACLPQPMRWLASVETNGHGMDVAGTEPATDLMAEHAGWEAIPSEAQGEEFLMMGLRLSEGVPLARFERLAGRPLDATRLKPLIADGLLALDGPTLRATPQGRLVLNSLLKALLA